MTLIVGIKCSDGVVMGADSTATLGSGLGQMTSRQSVANKLSIIEGCIVVGVSGFSGLAQRIRGELEDMWAEKKLSGVKRPDQAGVLIRERLWVNVLAGELEAASVAQKLLGQAARNTALCSTVVALPVGKKPCLLQFDQQGSPDVVSADEVPFAAIGSGQVVADPFLGFLRRLLWDGREPSLHEAVRTALWTLQHAIDLTPSGAGVGGDIHIVVLRDNCKATELKDDDLQDHKRAITGAEAAMRDYVRSLDKPAGEGEVEPPPKPA